MLLKILIRLLIVLTIENVKSKIVYNGFRFFKYKIKTNLNK